jgi:hypothetical protein
MKQVMNFRLSSEAVSILALLKEELHASKTDIIEDALRFYAKKKLAQEQPLLKFAGILNEKESQTMLSVIRSSRKNKKREIKL